MTIIIIVSIYRELAYFDENESIHALYLGRLLVGVQMGSGFLGFCKKRRGPKVETMVKKQLGKSLDELVQVASTKAIV